jgi:hypothetical protein
MELIEALLIGVAGVCAGTAAAAGSAGASVAAGMDSVLTVASGNAESQAADHLSKELGCSNPVCWVAHHFAVSVLYARQKGFRFVDRLHFLTRWMRQNR